MSAVRKAVERNRGRLVKTIGDGTLNEFGSTVEAMRATLEILGATVAENRGKPDDKCVELRMGLAVGDIVPEGDDILGDSVNLAARLQAEASPGTICTTEHVRDDLANKKMELTSEDLGPRELKGIGRPVRVVQITLK
jgi:adenylate cyclase